MENTANALPCWEVTVTDIRAATECTLFRHTYQTEAGAKEILRLMEAVYGRRYGTRVALRRLEKAAQ